MQSFLSLTNSSGKNKDELNALPKKSIRVEHTLYTLKNDALSLNPGEKQSLQKSTEPDSKRLRTTTKLKVYSSLGRALEVFYDPFHLRVSIVVIFHVNPEKKKEASTYSAFQHVQPMFIAGLKSNKEAARVTSMNKHATRKKSEFCF